jgi:tRNA dimethylallyltransferase
MYVSPKLIKNGLIVILGATATGKTALAIQLAQVLKSPILSADSRQVYRYFDIGTSKSNYSDRQGIPHYLIDIAEPDTTLTLAEYQAQAQTLISDFHSQEITPILVGGTGLYLKSIVCGMKIPKVAPDLALRSQLCHLGQTYCHQMLLQVDPETKIHANDQFRTIRALEVFYITGKSLTEQQFQSPPTYPILQIGINTPKDHLKIVGDRIDQMLTQGWLEEIKFIQDRYGHDLPLLKTLGYAEMSDYLMGKTDLDTAKYLTTTHTMQFAKHQRTWFRGNKTINWLEEESGDRLKKLLNLFHNRENWQIHSHQN